MIGWSSPSIAHIDQIVIDQTVTVNFTPIISGTSTPGSATSYTIYQGRVFGELKPNDPDNNKIITDIDLAPKNKGRVQYAANFRSSHRPIPASAMDSWSTRCRIAEVTRSARMRCCRV
jgi:hypothetical protein